MRRPAPQSSEAGELRSARSAAAAPGLGAAPHNGGSTAGEVAGPVRARTAARDASEASLNTVLDTRHVPSGAPTGIGAGTRPDSSRTWQQRVSTAASARTRDGGAQPWCNSPSCSARCGRAASWRASAAQQAVVCRARQAYGHPRMPTIVSKTRSRCHMGSGPVRFRSEYENRTPTSLPPTPRGDECFCPLGHRPATLHRPPLGDSVVQPGTGVALSGLAFFVDRNIIFGNSNGHLPLWLVPGMAIKCKGPARATRLLQTVP